MAHVEARGQLCGVGSFLPPLCGPLGPDTSFWTLRASAEPSLRALTAVFSMPHLPF